MKKPRKTGSKASLKAAVPNVDADAMLAAMRRLKATSSYRVLEQRVVFDGAAVDTAVQAVDAGSKIADPAASTAAADPAADAAPHALDLVAALASGAVDPAAAQQEIVFIDSAVQNLNQLISTIPPQAEIVMIDHNSGGLDQIAGNLAGRTDIASIQILSHGDFGTLIIGKDVITTDNIDAYRQQLAAIGQSLTADGDILLYGCDIGFGGKGQEFVKSFADLTGADVAASTDVTGSAVYGGNWDLEERSGAIEARVIDSSTWDGVLNPIVPTAVTGLPAVAGMTLANNIKGAGITISSATFSGDNSQAGTFTSATGYTPNWLGYDAGILLSTGNLAEVIGANTAATSNTTVDAPSAGTGADADFTALGAGSSFDTASVSITFVPTASRITLQFTFGSEEYNEYVYSNFNDVMGVWVNGVIASLTPDNKPITIDSINQAGTYNPSQGSLLQDPFPNNGVFDSAAPALYVDNTPGAGKFATGMDGFTRTLTLIANVNVGVANTIKLGVADISDFQLDSFLFVRAGSLQCETIALTDTVTTAKDTAVTINALANDIDISGHTLRITGAVDSTLTAGGSPLTLANGATVALTLGGNLLYTPPAGYTGPDLFTYSIDDGTGVTAVGYVNVTVLATPVVDLNSAPNTSERITGGTFGTTTSAAPAAPWVEGSQTGSGSVVLNGSDGRWDWVTSPGVNSTLTQAVTPQAGGAIDSIYFDLAWQNTDVSAPSDNTLTVAYNGTTYAKFTTFAAGTANAAGLAGTWVYSNGASGPAATNSVADEVTGALTNIVINLPLGVKASGNLTFTYGNGTTGAGTDNIAIDNVSVKSSLPDGSYNYATTFTENGAAVAIASASASVFDSDSVNLSGVTVTLTNPQSGDRLLVNGSALGSGTLASGIGWTRTNSLVTLSGTFTKAQYAAALSLITFENTTDAVTASVTRTIQVQATDSESQTSNIAVASITAVEVNDAPAGADKTITTLEDTAVTLAAADFGFSDVDGNSLLAVKITTLPAGGTLRNNGVAVTAGQFISVADITSGKLVFTPAANANGTAYANFTFQVQDNGGTANGGVDLDQSANTITFNVTPVNDAPVAANDAITTPEDQAFNGTLPVATDVDGDALTYAAGGTSPSHGSVTVNADGSYVYTPAANYNGSDTFTYTVTDGTVTIEKTVTVTVTPVNDAPVAANDAITTPEDQAFNGTLPVATDVDGDALTYAAGGTSPSHGSVTVNADGTYVYTPAANYNGSDTFTYTVTDGTVTIEKTVTVTVTPVNDAPVAVANSYGTSEDVALTIAATGILGNDTDTDGDALTAVLVSGPAHGTLSLNSDGSFTYTPDLNYNGSDSFTYKANDGSADSNVATVTISIGAVNDAPVAANDAITTPEDTAFNGTLPVATDVDGDPLTYAAGGTSPSHGSVTVNADGTYVYTPAANYNGADTFTYTVTDGTVTVEKTVTVTVTPVNDAPVAANDAITTPEDTAFNGTLPVASDVDGDALTYAAGSTSPSHGSVVINADGSYVYTPAANYHGSDTFTYTVTDGTVTIEKTVTVTVTPVNDAPVAANDAITTPEDQAFNGTLPVATDVDGDPLTYAAGGTSPSHGSVTINADGTYTYTPAANYNGSDTFTYTVTDGTVTVEKTVTVTVTPVNDAPVAANDAITTPEDTAFNGTLPVATDVDGDALTYAAGGTSPSHGSVTVNADGTYVYTPAANYNGSDTFTYTVTDGTVTVEKTVTVTVTPVNDAPVAANDAITTPEDQAFNGTLPVATDVDGDPLTYAAGGTSPSHGSVTVNADGTYVYTPAANYNGSDTFTYTVTDGTVTVEKTVTVTVTPVNDAPVAANDAITTPEDQAFNGTLPVATDVDGDALTYAAGGTSPSHGSVTVNADGTYTYTPAANYNGSDTFTYTVTDGTVTVEKTVTVTVTPVNDAPVAVANSYGTSEDVALTIAATGILGNDSDIDGDALTAVLVSGPAHGTLSLNSDGSFTYTPDLNYNGSDSFTYKANDGSADSNVATVTISIGAVNDAPVASNDAITTPEDTAFNGTLPVATDVDGDPLTYAAGGTSPSHGSVTVNADGSYVYTPAANYNGSDTFTYTVTDGTVTVEKTVTVTVTPVNDAPVAANDAITTPEDTVFNGTLPVATDVDGDPLTYAAGGTSPSHGSVTVNADGTYVYTPAANYNGSDTFTYTVTDGTVTVEKTVTVTVTPVNDAPVAANDAITTPEDTAFNGTLPVATDVDGDPLTYAAGGTSPSHGSVTVNADGTYVYTPAANYNGADTFTYTVTDGTVTVEKTVTVTVTPVNDAPVAANDAITTPEDTAFNGTLPVASDVDGDALTYAAGSTSPSHGSVVINADGSYVYTPAANYHGSDTFTYTVTDGTVTIEKTVTVTVTPVNDAPVAANDAITTPEDQAFNGTLPVATDVDGDPLTYAAGGTSPSHGSVTINADGTYTYTPAANYNGSDTFTYTVTDGTVTVEKTVTVTVTPVNDAPVAANDAITTPEDTAFNGTLPVATDVDGDALTYAAGGTSPSHGSVTVNADGTYVYTPAANYNGSDTFTYTVTDGTVTVEKTVTVTVTPVNDAPVAANDAITTPEDTAFNGTLPVATDVDGDPLTYAAGGTSPSHGSVTVNADGTYVYTPAANYNGSDTFTYTVTDGTVTVEKTVTVTVTPVNDAPVAANDAITTPEDTAFNGTLPVATDVDGDALTYAAGGTSPSHGSVTINADGTYTYTPAANYNGSDTFTYTVTDGTVTVEKTVTVTVTPVNDAPVAANDAITTPEDQAFNGTLPVATDVDGDPLTYAAGGTSPSHGSVTVNADGTYVYTPAANYNGSDTFTYTVTDGTVTVEKTVTVTVTPVNDAPVAANDAITTPEDQAFNGTLPVATDVDGDALTYAAGGTSPSHGSVTVNADGTYVYTPAANYNGSDTFTYTVTDGTVTVEKTVTVTVTPVNDAPVAANDAITTPEDQAFNGTLPVATDVDGDALTYAAGGTSPSHGSVTVNADGTYTYTPAANYNGSDTFTYTVTDGTVTVEKTVTVTVTPVNDAPVAVANSYGTSEDVALTIAATGILGNDSDIDGDALTAVLVSGPAHGTLSLNSDGSFTYTPDLNYNGSDSFTYKANDGSADSNVATVTISIGAVNDAPVASNDAITTPEDTAFNGTLPVATDVDGDPLTYAAGGTSPSHGSVTVNADGSYVYTPAANYNGSDTFTYTVTDGTVTVEKTVTVTVTPVNDAPVAANDAITTPEDTVFNGTLPVATDVDGDPLTYAAGGTSPSHGSVTVNADGTYVYTPAANYNGSDTFTYTVTDGTVTVEKTVTVTVTPVNDAPVAANDAITTPEDTAFNGTLPVATDVDGDPLTYAAGGTSPSHGSVTVNADGTYVYTPAANYNGSDTFTYTVTDGTVTVEKTVTVTVTPVNDAPVAANDAITTPEDTAFNGTLPVASDVDGDALTYAAGSTSPSHGSVVINADGSYVYTPAANYHGSDTFTYTVTDGTVTIEKTVTVTVTPVNDAPVAANDAITTPEDQAFNGTLPVATDVDGDPLTYAAGGTSPSHGSVTINADGTYTYTPAANYNGSDTFTYTVTDGTVTVEKTVTVTVTPVNDAPVAANDAITTPEDTAFNGTLPVATDVDGDALTYAAGGTSPSHGSVTVNADGTYVYTPAANYNGSDTFTYTVTDGTVTVEKTVTVTVTPVNDAPVAANDAITTPEDTAFNGTLPVATDVDGDPLTYAAGGTSPSHGSVTVNADGTYVYTPAANYNGSDTFTYTVTDGTVTVEKTVTVTVTPVNDAPVAANDAITTPEDTAFNGTLPVATDVDGDALTYAAGGTSPSHGSVTINADGTYTYTPAANYNGSDTFTYTVTDGTVTVEKTVTVTVTPVNDAPVAANDAITTPEDQAFNGTLPVATDVDGDPLTYAAGGTSPSHGSVTVNADGTYVYTPAANYNGSDTFTYTVTDGTVTVEKTVTVTVTPVNDAPVAANDAITTPEDQAFNGTLPVATDVDGDALTYAAGGTSPSHGSVTVNADGTYVYTPAANYNGSDTFTYTVTDGTVTVEKTVTVTVTPVNDAPVAANDAITTPEDQAFNGTLPVATDVDGDALTYAAGGTSPSHGSVTVNADGTYTYTPAANYNGSDTFTYTVTDGTVTVEKTVTVTVTPVNDAPVAVANSYGTSEDVALTIAATGILGNDSDIDGDALTAVLVSGPAHGTLSLNSDGSFTYTPDLNYNGSDSFTYKANDGSADSNVATVTISIGAVNDAPVASNDAITTPEDTAFNGTLPVATDVDGDPLTYAAGGTSPSHGSVTVNADGSYVYTPAANYNGSDTFTYTVTDGTVTVEKTVTVTVTPVNDAPVAANDAITTPEDTVFNGTLPVATDVDGDPLTYAAGGTSPSHGSVTVNADGTYVYTPAANYNGSDTFTYTVTDGTVTVEKTVTVTVTPVNDAPVAANDAITTPEDTAFNGTLPVATDVDGDPLTYAAGGTSPSHGSVTVNADGTYVYTPAANYNGSDTFTYTVTDGTVTVEKTVTVTVTPVNDAPVAANDAITTPEDTAFNGTLPVASDVDGDALTYAAGSTSPSHGSVVINADGSYVYTPAANYHGSDTFTYTVTDGTVTIEKTVTVTVTPVNDAPVAANDAITTPEDQAFNGTLPVATDVDGDPLTYAAGGTSPSHGSVTINADGTYTYTPAANYNGSDTFTYTVTDGTVTVEKTVTVTVTPVNDAPVAANDAITTPEDTAFNGTLPVATDVDGDALTYAAGGTSPSHGSVTVNADGTYVYTPAANYNGSDTFTYTVTDGTVTVEKTVTVTVTPVNDAPVAANDAITTPEDTAFNGTLPVATDVDGDPLTYAAGGTSPSHGSVTVNADGTYVYTPAANYNGSDTFTYTVTDGTVTVEKTVTVTVTPVNDAPVAANDAITTPEDTAFNGTLPVATDVDGDALTYAAGGTSPSHGSVTINADGTYTYTPAANYNGSDTFTYTVTDGTVTVEKTVTVTVTPVNDAPVAANDAITTPEDQAFNGTLPVATDVDGDPLTYAAGGTSPSHGSVTVNADGTYVYTPAANYNGSDTFTYTVTDGTVTVEKTVTVTVTPVNDAPVAANDAITTPEDQAFNGTLPVATDVDGDALTYAAGGTSPSHGSVTVNADGTYVYTPAANYNGSDTFTYTVTDGTVTVEKTVTVTVTPVNDAPVAANDAITTPEDQAFNGTLPVATDVDGDALTYAAGGTSPSHGSVTVNADGTYTYTPAANYNGSDTFTYTVTDGTVTVEKTVTVTVTPVNDAPVAVANSYGTSEDVALTIAATGILGNDSDIDGDALTAVLVSGPAHGTLSLNSDGSFTYTPDLNYNGSDSFTYKANDGSADSNVATVTISIGAVNDAPVASNDAITTPEDTAFNGTLPVATDVDGDPLTYAAGGTSPSHGSVTVNADGSYVYTPAANYNGSDTFTYTVTDGTVTVEKTVTVTVTPVNDAPVAANDAITTPEDTVFNGTLPVATDVDGDPLTYAAGGTSPSHGSVTVNADGTYVYTPAANYNGSDTFTYTVTDGTVTVEKTVTVTVTPVNDAPVAANDAITTPEDTAFNGTLPVATDVDGDPLTYAAGGTSPSHGSVTVNADGTYVYTPAANYNGADTFTYTVTDGTVTVEKTVTVTVTPVNDAPVAANDAITTPEDTAFNGTLPVASDVDGDALTYAAGSTSPSHGSVVINADGSYVYTPAANYHGSDTFTYTVTDGTVTIEKTVTVTVTPVNDAPVAANDAITTPEDQAFNGTLPVATDVDGDPLTYAAGGTSPSHGSVTINADGTYTYTPAANYNGSDTFTYTVTDGTVTVEKTVTVTVTPVNDAPVAANDAITTPEDTAFNGTLPVATDVDGDALTYAAGGTSPSHGSVTVNADGTYVYTPAANYNGSDTFTYTVTDGTVTVEKTVTVTVTPVNDAPVAANDAITTPEDTAFNGTLPVATDVDGDPLTYAAGGTSPSHGSVTVNADGTYVYTPAANYNGSDTFTYTVTDGTVTVEKTVTVTVTPVNDAPVAANDAITTPEDTAFNGTLPVATDVDGDALTYAAGGTSPSHGSVTINADGTYTYTPAANYNGSDTFTYTVTDGTVTVEKTVTVTVTPVNDAPVAANDAITTPEDQAFNGTLPVATDVDGDPLTYAAGGTSPSHGSVTVNADGTYVYTPAANYNGSDTFTYTVTDGTVTVEKTVTVTVTPVNDAPVAANDAITTPEDQAFNGTLPVATDVDGDALTYAAGGTSPSHGSVTVNADGTYVYTPAANYNGSDTFTYTVTDGTVTVEKTVTVTVTPVNDAPVAANDAITTPEDQAFNGTLPVATDVDGDALTYAAGGTSPSHGSVTVNADGTYTYTPAANYNGSDTFTYTVTDGTVTVEKTVTVTVTSVDDPVTNPADRPVVLPEATRPAPTGIRVEGIVLDTVNGAAPLSGQPGDLGTNGIVTDTVNRISPLGSSLNGTLNISNVSRIIGPSRLIDIWHTAFSVSDGRALNRIADPEGLTGFSLHMSLGNRGIEGSSRSQVIVESIVRDRTLIIQLSNSLSGLGKQVSEYRILQADGTPVPGWLDRVGADLLIGQRPANQEHISLRIVVIYSDGTSEAKEVQIETMSGEIKAITDARRSGLAIPFAQQFAANGYTGIDGLDELAGLIAAE